MLFAFITACLAYSAQDRLLLVSWAPPAAGKTAAMKLFTDTHGITSFLDVRVDDLMMENEEYRKLSKQLKEMVVQSEPDESAFPWLCKLSSALYFPHRAGGERQGNAMLLSELVKPARDRQHILFELTGSNAACFWLKRLSRLFRDEGYRVHLIVPVAKSVEQLKERAWKRLLNPAGKEFRLPCPHLMAKYATESQINTLSLLQRHLQPDALDGFVIDGISLIDSGSAKPALAFEALQGEITHCNHTLLKQSHLEPYHQVIKQSLIKQDL